MSALSRSSLALWISIPCVPLAGDPSPDWTAGGEQQAALLGFAVASAGDVNGDGHSDVLAGAFTFDGVNGNNSGRAFLWLGAPGGPATAPDWTADGAAQGEHFGFAVACAGDVNGDGFSDVIVGAPRAANGELNEGRVSLYLGGAAGPSSAPDWTAESNQAGARLGHSVAAAGDVNGDGYGDVVVGAPFFDAGQEDEGRAFLFLGSVSGLAASPAWTSEGDQADAEFALAVAPAGDVDGDGYDDVVVGARRRDGGETDEGAALVYLGSAAGLAPTPGWSAESNQAGALFGTSVSGAGDVNGDGYADVIVGASLYDAGEIDEGAAFVYLGSVTGLGPNPAWTADGDQTGAELGVAVACAGDWNGDGRDDVVVGTHLHEDDTFTDEGKAMLFLGSSAGVESSPAWSVDSDETSAELGRSVARAGDVDGDGYGDVLVGAPFRDDGPTDEGWVHLFRGGADDLADAAAWTMTGTETNAFFAVSVSMAGDVNGDGYSEVIVGESRFGGSDAGRALVFMGSPAGLTAGPVLTGQSFPQAFGESVARAGDVNGDGYDDVIVGEPNHTSFDAFEGRVHVFHGSAGGLTSPAAWTFDGPVSTGFLGGSVAGAGDVNGDGYGDVLAAGGAQAYFFPGSASGLGNRAWTSPASSEYRQVAAAGDVNGDGYSDVAFGSSVARVHVGGPAGIGTSVVLTGPSSTWAATAGDVNGDGYADVIVGSGSETRVHLGSGAGIATTAAWTVPVGASSSVATAGDVDGDGYSDVVIGTVGGGASAYLGSASGLASVAAWTAAPTANFSASVAQAGDVNGDGYGDVIVGATNFNGSSGNARVFLGNGGRGSGLVRALRQRRRDDSAPIALLGNTTADGYFRIRCAFPRNRTGWASPAPPLGYLEWEVKPLGIPFDGNWIGRSRVGRALEPAGAPVIFDEEVRVPGVVRARRIGSPPWASDVFRWRARIATTDPLFPRTAWFDLAGNAVTEAKLRRP